MLKKILKVWGFCGVLVVFGCARAPLKKQEEALRVTSEKLRYFDDLGLENLKTQLQVHILALEKLGQLQQKMTFGSEQLTRQQYLQSLRFLLSEFEKDPSGAYYFRALKKNFKVMEVYGGKSWGDVLVTSYYEPVISGSKTYNIKHSQPLYSKPKDMVIIQWDEFEEKLPHLKRDQRKEYEQKSARKILRGRIETSKSGFPVIHPYYSRAEIDQGYALSQKGMELVWVNPIDAFFLQIQGSGTVRIEEDGAEIRLGYAAQNGHPYVPIGRHLLDVIPREKMSLQAIQEHLSKLTPEKRQEVLNLNPSYVFFEPLEGRPVTYSGVEVIDGRTIATDKNLFPKGALGYLVFEKPVFLGQGKSPVGWQSSSRFVFDHDTGGAIRGPHRVDLFWGKGASAKKMAGVMKNPGRLYYFLPKLELLKQLEHEADPQE